MQQLHRRARTSAGSLIRSLQVPGQQRPCAISCPSSAPSIPPGLLSGKGASWLSHSAGVGGQGQPTVGSALERGGIFILPFPFESLWSEAQLRESEGWTPAITDAQHNMLSPRPTPRGGRKGVSACCPNIWTQREPRCTIQMFSKLSARCWQRADIWVEHDPYVRGERVGFVQEFRVMLAQS